MKFLLDTHTLLWWILDDLQLSVDVRAIIDDPANRLFVSAASAWGIALKFSVNKLALPESPTTLIPRILREEGFIALPISVAHALETQDLPLHHKDPFDRILIAQAMVGKMPLLTADAAFAAYPVQTIW